MKEDSVSAAPIFARDLLHYLIQHPDATDTIQGIVQWWLKANDGPQCAQKVQDALDYLVTKGWITETQLPSPKVYAMNKAFVADVRAFLSRFDRLLSEEHGD